MVKTQKYILDKQFEGEPKRSDLSVVEEELPALKDGEYLVEAEYLSVDPYMRGYIPYINTGRTMLGSQVARIIESKNPDFPVGGRILGNMGWRKHTIINPKIPGNDENSMLNMTYLLPDFGDLPASLGLGVLGMPGNTAYFGFLEVCQPKKGETVVVSGAAGAVGSHVGQIAKMYGLNVIGIAGSDPKCKWLKEELGFDHAINYKTQNIHDALKECAPNGVDCYFDNVGGDMSSTVLNHMNLFGRISVCGSISSYNANPNDLPKSPIVQLTMVLKQLKMEGFIVTRWEDRWFEGIQKNMEWIREGKLKYRETVTDGFENMFDAFVGMLHGDNFGKAIVKA